MHGARPSGIRRGVHVFRRTNRERRPFSWLAGKNQQQQQAPATGGGPGTLPFFGGRSGAFRSQPDITAVPRASDLPVNDPETYMITNPPLGTPTLSSRNIDATKAAIQRYQLIVAQGGWPMVPARRCIPVGAARKSRLCIGA